MCAKLLMRKMAGSDYLVSSWSWRLKSDEWKVLIKLDYLQLCFTYETAIGNTIKELQFNRSKISTSSNSQTLNQCSNGVVKKLFVNSVCDAASSPSCCCVNFIDEKYLSEIVNNGENEDVEWRIEPAITISLFKTWRYHSPGYVRNVCKVLMCL